MCDFMLIIISMTKLLDADWLRSAYNYLINCTAVQLMFCQNKQKKRKAKWRGKPLKHEGNCPRGT